MAKLTEVRNENFDTLLERIESGILKGSVTASLEETGDFREGDARCSIRVFERYSYAGSNRVSLTVTLFQQGQVHLSLETEKGFFISTLPPSFSVCELSMHADLF